MPTLQLPNLDQKAIKKRARENAPSYKLYYPGKTWLITQYAGNFYAFPPDLGGRIVEHPFLKDEDGNPKKVVADGILHTKDRYGVIYGKRAKPTTHPIYGYPMGMALPVEDPEGKMEEETADKVVMFFTTKFGSSAIDPSMALGITMLTDNTKEDQEIKKISQRMHVESRSKWAEAQRVARLEDLEKWKKTHPGQTNFPPMTAAQRLAEEILLNAEEVLSVSTMRFVCHEGDFETDDEKLFFKHMALRHNMAEADVPRRPGRPKKKVSDEVVEAEPQPTE